MKKGMIKTETVKCECGCDLEYRIFMEMYCRRSTRLNPVRKFELPEIDMKGSEKQNDWANSLRMKFAGYYQTLINDTGSQKILINKIFKNLVTIKKINPENAKKFCIENVQDKNLDTFFINCLNNPKSKSWIDMRDREEEIFVNHISETYNKDN